MDASRSTRDRLVTESMRLFAERGYASTSVADIEAAAGLSAGSGSLYRHFRSKEALLTEGVRQRIREAGALHTTLDQSAPPGTTLQAEAEGVVRAGLQRLQAERDLNLIMLRDLKQFPELVAAARDEELAETHRRVRVWVEHRAAGRGLDPQALAAILVGATAHFWLLRDIFGEHPSGVSEDDFVAGLAQAAVRLLA